MAVQHYLRYVGEMKGLHRRDARRAASAAIASCSLEPVADRLIGTLSKGFRQRVGIAQALVGAPRVLILDEPTSGLDPEQVADMRALIRDLRAERTVILSTHILPEVEATCDRVIIIHRGRVLALDTPANLNRRVRQTTQVVVEVSGPPAEVLARAAGGAGRAHRRGRAGRRRRPRRGQRRCATATCAKISPPPSCRAAGACASCGRAPSRSRRSSSPWSPDRVRETMKLLVICRRELSAYFGSVVAYVLLAVFLVLSGYFFYSDLVFFILFGGFTLATGLWQFVFLDMRMVAMLILPLLTMRLFAEEKKLGTHGAPVDVSGARRRDRARQVLRRAGSSTSRCCCRPRWGRWSSITITRSTSPPVLAGYLGMVLLGAAFIACGLFVSSLTENQVVSAMVTYGIIVLFWFLTWNEEAATHDVMRWLLGVSLFDRFFNFTRGVIDTRDVVFFALFTGFFLFLTWQSLATRSWRGVR